MIHMSGNNAVRKVLWPCLETRLLWVLDLPSLTLLPNKKDTIRQSMETFDATTIKEVFDLLKAGQWLKGVITLGSLSFEASKILKDIRERG